MKKFLLISLISLVQSAGAFQTDYDCSTRGLLAYMDQNAETLNSQGEKGLSTVSTNLSEIVDYCSQPQESIPSCSIRANEKDKAEIYIGKRPAYLPELGIGGNQHPSAYKTLVENIRDRSCILKERVCEVTRTRNPKKTSKDSKRAETAHYTYEIFIDGIQIYFEWTRYTSTHEDGKKYEIGDPEDEVQAEIRERLDELYALDICR